MADRPSRNMARRPSNKFLSSYPGLNKAAAGFLKIDTETALTFSGIAMQTTDPVKRERMIRFARKAHDTVLNLMDAAMLTKDDAQILARNLQRLRSELASLGEVF